MKPLLLARQVSYGPARNPRLIDVDLQLGRRPAGIAGHQRRRANRPCCSCSPGFLPPTGGARARTAPRPGGAGTAAAHRLPAAARTRVCRAERGREPALGRSAARPAATGAGRAIERVLLTLQLDKVRARLAGRLSQGMLQRLGLAQAVLHEPDILILDEPTAGLDPLQTEQIRELLGRSRPNCSLILATHLLDDVQRLCDRVILLDGGRKRSEHAVTPDTDLLAHFRQPMSDQGGRVIGAYRPARMATPACRHDVLAAAGIRPADHRLAEFAQLETFAGIAPQLKASGLHARARWTW